MLTGSFSISLGHGVISSDAAPAAVYSTVMGPMSPAQNRTVKPCSAESWMPRSKGWYSVRPSAPLSTRAPPPTALFSPLSTCVYSRNSRCMVPSSPAYRSVNSGGTVTSSSPVSQLF